MGGTTMKEQYWKYGLMLILLLLGFLIFKEFSRFLSGLLGACVIYILVRNQMKRLIQKRRMKPMLAASLIMLEVLLCFLIPIFGLAWLISGQFEKINLDPSELMASIQHFSDLITQKIGYNLLSKDNVSTLVGYSTKVGQVIIAEASGFVINSLVMMFILFFMLAGQTQMESYLFDILPFNDKNKKEVLRKIDIMVKSNAIGIPVLGLIQGVLATAGYIIFDVPEPILLGFLTCFATIIPLFGTSLVWFPAVVYLAMSGQWSHSIGLVLYALLVISSADNLARFMLQKKIANIHPLITVFGVVIGISLFGFWGVIIGPLLLSLFLLLFNMFKVNYLDKNTKAAE